MVFTPRSSGATQAYVIPWHCPSQLGGPACARGPLVTPRVSGGRADIRLCPHCGLQTPPSFWPDPLEGSLPKEVPWQGGLRPDAEKGCAPDFTAIPGDTAGQRGSEETGTQRLLPI